MYLQPQLPRQRVDGVDGDDLGDLVGVLVGVLWQPAMAHAWTGTVKVTSLFPGSAQLWAN